MRKILSMLIIFTLCFGQVGCSRSEIDTVLADLPIAAEIAISVVSIVSAGDTEHTQEVTEYAGRVSADLKLLESLITQYKSLLREQPGAPLPRPVQPQPASGTPAAAVQAEAATLPAAAVPAPVLAQMNAALTDAQANLTAILNAVGVGEPKVTAAVAAAVGSVKLILNDAALLIQANAPPAVTAQLFFGAGIPGVDFMGMAPSPAQHAQQQHAQGEPAATVQKASGKSARQVAKEFNQKISKDFPKAKVNVPKIHVMGVAVPMTGGR